MGDKSGMTPVKRDKSCQIHIFVLSEKYNNYIYFLISTGNYLLSKNDSWAYFKIKPIFPV